jgi:hypothetical protein
LGYLYAEHGAARRASDVDLTAAHRAKQEATLRTAYLER